MNQPLAEPSTNTLIKASVAAALLAGATLLAVILPAEYNMDPTGIGKALGLTRLAVANPVQAVDPVKQDTSGTRPFRSDQIKIEVPAGQGLEYKLHLLQYGELQYEWQAEGGELYFDFHGEPEGDTTGYYKSFAVSTADAMKGSLNAPFAGSHGWYWKNASQNSVTVTLKMQGFYEVIGLK